MGNQKEIPCCCIDCKFYPHIFIFKFLHAFSFSLQEKLETMQRESYIQVTTLQDENTQVRTMKEEMTKYIRELEQTNDDLERAKRYDFFIIISVLSRTISLGEL